MPLITFAQHHRREADAALGLAILPKSTIPISEIKSGSPTDVRSLQAAQEITKFSPIGAAAAGVPTALGSAFHGPKSQRRRGSITLLPAALFASHFAMIVCYRL